jgi:hypothetical protein
MLIANSPNVADIRARLRNNVVLRHLSDIEWAYLEPMLVVEDYAKGATLESQGERSVDQYFILDGILKRVVANPAGKEMILRFAAETDIETSYAAWRLDTPIPFSIIAPVILVICAIGAYTVHSSMFDVWLMLIFGVVGYVFKKTNYPLAPLVLALVLGDRAEDSFRQSMLLSQGELGIFYANPLVGSLTTLAIALLIWPVLGALWDKVRGR